MFFTLSHLVAEDFGHKRNASQNKYHAPHSSRKLIGAASNSTPASTTINGRTSPFRSSHRDLWKSTATSTSHGNSSSSHSPSNSPVPKKHNLFHVPHAPRGSREAWQLVAAGVPAKHDVLNKSSGNTNACAEQSNMLPSTLTNITTSSSSSSSNAIISRLALAHIENKHDYHKYPFRLHRSNFVGFGSRGRVAAGLAFDQDRISTKS